MERPNGQSVAHVSGYCFGGRIGEESTAVLVGHFLCYFDSYWAAMVVYSMVMLTHSLLVGLRFDFFYK